MTDGAPRTLHIHEAILSRNTQLAEDNRATFRARGILAANMLSSPGSGKTALLERTLADLSGELTSAVIVGDLATDNDARRLAGHGAKVVQIATGDICHLDAKMVARALPDVDSPDLRLLFIENVGNLVCPAAYDLGEALRVVLLSVTEGEDKPAKYPTLFKSADIALITKIDLAEATGFDRAAAHEAISRIAPQARILELSSRSGQGMSEWYDLLRARIPSVGSAGAETPTGQGRQL